MKRFFVAWVSVAAVLACGTTDHAPFIGLDGSGAGAAAGSTSMGGAGRSGVVGAAGHGAAGSIGLAGASGSPGSSGGGGLGSSGASGMNGGAGLGASGSSGTNGSAGLGASGGSGASGNAGSGTSGRSGASGNAGSGTSGGSGSGGAAGNPAAPFLGQACTADTECGGSPLICLTSSSTGWGGSSPPHGLCTLPCSSSSDCQVIAPDAACLTQGGAGYCVEGCLFGTAPAGKCHGRSDFACGILLGGSLVDEVCGPMCNGNVDCPSGRTCDPNTGFCVTASRGGDPEGTQCAAGSDTCKGICLLPDGNSPSGTCVDLCSTGSPCLFDSSNQAHGGCLGYFIFSNAPYVSNIGDIGWCNQSCACDRDCPVGYLCDTWPGTPQQSQEQAALYGNIGGCVRQAVNPPPQCN